MQDLSDKTILITGASRGIGLSAAKRCADLGGEVLIHASSESDDLLRAAESLGLPPNKVLVEDLSQPNAGASLFAKALAASGRRLNSLVNNAGVYLPTPINDDDAWGANWQRTFAINVSALADLSRAAVQHFTELGGGRIVNIASRAGQRGDGPDHAAYAASKGAVLAFTKSMARAVAEDGILMYAIAPGWVATRMAPADIENRKRAAADIPLGRVADPSEVANLIGYLLTDGCPSATGATFDVNGASYVR
ncbi:MAG: SDR family oxidoreductase [Pseudomonadota bacterium]